LIQFKNLTLARGTKVLIEEASFQLHPSHKVGLTLSFSLEVFLFGQLRRLQTLICKSATSNDHISLPLLLRS
jgi:hypothetical protein